MTDRDITQLTEFIADKIQSEDKVIDAILQENYSREFTVTVIALSLLTKLGLGFIGTEDMARAIEQAESIYDENNTVDA